MMKCEDLDLDGRTQYYSLIVDGEAQFTSEDKPSVVSMARIMIDDGIDYDIISVRDWCILGGSEEVLFRNDR